MTIDHLRELTALTLRSLSEEEQSAIAELRSLPFHRAWALLEKTMGGPLLVEALCRTEVCVEASLLLFIAPEVLSVADAQAWIYLLCHRRASRYQEVDWESMFKNLPPDLWPDSAAVRECAAAGFDDPAIWVGLAA